MPKHPTQKIVVADDPCSVAEYTRTDVTEARIKELESAFRSILQVPNSDAAQGIMKAFAEDALGTLRVDGDKYMQAVIKR